MLGEIIVGAILAFASARPGRGKYVDLTHPTGEGYTLQWPTEKPFQITRVFDGITDGGVLLFGQPFLAGRAQRHPPRRPRSLREGQMGGGRYPLRASLRTRRRHRHFLPRQEGLGHPSDRRRYSTVRRKTRWNSGRSRHTNKDGQVVSCTAALLPFFFAPNWKVIPGTGIGVISIHSGVNHFP